MRQTTSDIIEAHLAWLRLRGRSDATVRMRAGTLRRLSEHLGKRDILRVKLDDLEGFLSIRSKGQDARSVEGSHLRQFYKWAVARGHLGKDPTVLLAVPPKTRRLPRPLPIDDVIMAVELATPDVRLLLLAAVLAGLRAGEIARLSGEDVDWGSDPPLILVHGKGGRERRVPAPPQLAAALADAPRSGPIVRYEDGRADHVPAWLVSQRANQYLRSLGLTSIHTLRHTFATWFLRESGRDLRLTQETLGHVSPVSTAIYTRVDPADAAAVAARMELPFERRDA